VYARKLHNFLVTVFNQRQLLNVHRRFQCKEERTSVQSAEQPQLWLSNRSSSAQVAAAKRRVNSREKSILSLVGWLDEKLEVEL